ncbi:MAG: DedA family protein [Campylobacterota bacterium]|nr:DedA family protein [Campylobacterota bacterium]
MVDSYGPLGLFLSAFLAATLLPFSSEAALVAALASGMEHSTALIAASSGNLLAIMLNFGLGFWLSDWAQQRVERSKSGRKALQLSERYGYWALLLSPLPIVGDPVTLAAGLLRLNIFWFLAIAGTLRILRYWMITLAF